MCGHVSSQLTCVTNKEIEKKKVEEMFLNEASRAAILLRGGVGGGKCCFLGEIFFE